MGRWLGAITAGVLMSGAVLAVTEPGHNVESYRAQARLHEQKARQAEARYDPKATTTPAAGYVITADPFSRQQIGGPLRTNGAYAGPTNPTEHYLDEAQHQWNLAQADWQRARDLEGDQNALAPSTAESVRRTTGP